MSYIDRFVLAVPTANKQKFIAHATQFDSLFIDHGPSETLVTVIVRFMAGIGVIFVSQWSRPSHFSSVTTRVRS